MQPRSRSSPIARASLAALPLVALCGCGGSSFSSSSGSASAPAASNPTTAGSPPTPGFSGASALQGSNDSVVATAAVGDTFAVAVGAVRTLSVTFNSDDARMITGFAISGSLASLPAGWSGPENFTCGSVSVGSSCVLNLTYAPGAVDRGVLTLDYVYLDDATQPKTGDTLSIPYQATPTNNVVAMAAPTGQVDAVAGAGAQSVSVNFSTDDGNAATNLAVTSDLGALPAGWTSATTSLSCPVVSTGNGCELLLHYAPGAAAHGTLILNYGYTDESGIAKLGALTIPYATTSANNVMATASPSGQITAIQKTGGRSVPITFTTDDGKPATHLSVTSDLNALPSGWSTATNAFSCATVTGGNGCQLMLNYAPTALTGGTLTLQYAYQDGSGAARSGLLNVAYTATTDDNVTATASPAGPITAVVSDGSRPGNGGQPLSVTFVTDDGRPVTALEITSDLTMLPPGWSSTPNSPFACNAIDSDNACRLALTYAPTSAGAGTLVLAYAYANNAGEPRTGSVDIAYRATANDNVQWTATPLPARVRTGSSNPVSITFQTDDANPANALTITSPLNVLPAGWSSTASSFSCAAVSAGAGAGGGAGAGTACTLPLIYAPTAAAAGTLSLGYSYVNDAGYPGTGTVTISYGAYTPYLYAVNSLANTVSACALDLDDMPGPCSVAAGGFVAPTAIALTSTYAYVTDLTSVSRCALDLGGALTGCAHTGPPFVAPLDIAVDPTGSFGYVSDGLVVTLCTIAAADGALGGCAPTGPGLPALSGVALGGNGHAYSVGGGTLQICGIAAGGALDACAPAPAATPLATAALRIQDRVLYVRAVGGLFVCPIDAAAGGIGSCQTTAPGVGVNGLAFFGSAAGGDSTAYVSTGLASLLVCPVNPGGGLTTCTTHGDPTFGGLSGLALRPQ